jgi:acid phosphatase family membrane protein YuiD
MRHEGIMLPYFSAPMIAWIVTQFAKVVIKGRQKEWDWRNMYRSGSMPSSHAAVVVALAVYIFLNQGINSPEFGITSIFAAIVLYDAVNVRHAVGEHGVILRQLLIKEAKKNGNKVSNVRQSLGHTPIEVLAGSIVGALIALIVFVV